jgi:hypothetical protein
MQTAKTLTLNGVELPIQEWEKRFWSKVEVKGPDECWPWKGSRTNKGYGKLQFKTRKKTVTAHRLSLALHDPTFVDSPAILGLHSCDNPSCVNPKHLSQGSVADNNRDAFRKGRNQTIGSRAARGETHYNSKYLADTVREMRRLHDEEGLSISTLMERYKEFKPTRGSLFGIINRLTWRDVV